MAATCICAAATIAKKHHTQAAGWQACSRTVRSREQRVQQQGAEQQLRRTCSRTTEPRRRSGARGDLQRTEPTDGHDPNRSARLKKVIAHCGLLRNECVTTSVKLATVDHYEALGIDEDASNADIIRAFEQKVKEVAALAGKEDDDILRKQLTTLEDALETLTSEEQRRLYDWGVAVARQQQDDIYVWPYQADITQRTITPVTGPPRPMVPEDDEGIAFVRNFLLAWLGLSAVLNLVLK